VQKSIQMLTLPNPEIDVIDEAIEDIADIKLWELVVFNDDINTFDHVISTLVDVCKHTPEQAEQCTIIIHYKGKCGVKSGDFEELASLRTAICQREISAEIMLK
jgi:ATP-dependent Clp protease adaptor protein ClpS